MNPPMPAPCPTDAPKLTFPVRFSFTWKMMSTSPFSFADLFWRRPYVLLLLSPLFWAGNLLIGRAYGSDLPPFGLAFWRWIVALAFLLPFVWGDLREHGKEMLRQSGLNFTTADDMTEAARRVVSAAGGAK